MLIRVHGRGSFRTSPMLKQYITRLVSEPACNDILVDMEHCKGMDSTFMGVLAGLACLMKAEPNKTFTLINLSTKNEKLLTTLGVNHVLDYTTAKVSEEAAGMLKTEPEEVLDTTATGKLNAAQTSLEAHQTLVKIHPENFDTFKSVLELLENDVHNLGEG